MATKKPNKRFNFEPVKVYVYLIGYILLFLLLLFLVAFFAFEIAK